MKIELSEHFTYKKLLKFSYPVIISMIVSSIFGSVDDGLFVSNFVGKNAFTAINLVIPFIFIVSTVGFLFGSGGGALVSKMLGEGKKEQANEVFSMLVEIIFISSIIFACIGFIFMKPIAYMLGATEELLPYCLVYGRIQLAVLPLQAFWLASQGYLVVAEKPKAVFRITLAVSIANTILDIILIYILRLGIVGASIATASGQVIGGLASLIIFIFDKSSTLHFSFTKIEGQPMVISARNGVADMINNISMSVVNTLYNIELMKLYGEDGVVAYSIIMYVSFIFIGVYVGYSMAVAPVIAYNYGANNNTEMQSVVKKSFKLLNASAIVLTLLALLTAKPMCMIFVSYDLALLKFAIYALSIFSLSYLIQHINIFISNLFTALNDGKLASIISIPRTFIFDIVLIFLLPTLFGRGAIWFAPLIAEALTLFITLPLYFINRKKYNY